MNNLQKLIRLRGLTIREIADRIGYGYHLTQKVIKGTRRRTKSGGQGATFSNPAVETAVAELLGLSYDQAWGPGSPLALRRLISQEIKEQARRQEESLRQQWLSTDTVPHSKTAGNV